MTRRLQLVVLALLLVSSLGNVFQLLWANAGHRIENVTRGQFDAEVERAKVLSGSAAWHSVHVDREGLAILETGTLLNFRSLLGQTQACRRVFICTE